MFGVAYIVFLLSKEGAARPSISPVIEYVTSGLLLVDSFSGLLTFLLRIPS